MKAFRPTLRTLQELATTSNYVSRNAQDSHSIRIIRDTPFKNMLEVFATVRTLEKRFGPVTEIWAMKSADKRAYRTHIRLRFQKPIQTLLEARSSPDRRILVPWVTEVTSRPGRAGLDDLEGLLDSSPLEIEDEATAEQGGFMVYLSKKDWTIREARRPKRPPGDKLIAELAQFEGFAEQPTPGMRKRRAFWENLAKQKRLFEDDDLEEGRIPDPLAEYIAIEKVSDHSGTTHPPRKAPEADTQAASGAAQSLQPNPSLTGPPVLERTAPPVPPPPSRHPGFPSGYRPPPLKAPRPSRKAGTLLHTQRAAYQAHVQSQRPRTDAAFNPEVSPSTNDSDQPSSTASWSFSRLWKR